MTNKVLSKFYSEDNLREAEVFVNSKDVVCVNMYENIMPIGMTLVDTREFPGKSEQYAEDAAENYVTYILN